MSYRPDLNPAAGDWVAPEKANTALNRYGTVDEVVALVEFVVSPEAAYVTGANLTVDGGTNAYVNSRTVPVTGIKSYQFNGEEEYTFAGRTSRLPIKYEEPR